MQPVSEIRIHPLDLSAHGKTPAGLPLWRVVWSKSRRTLCRTPDDREVSVPLYWAIDYQEGRVGGAGHWILERWKPAAEFYGMTQAEHDAFLTANPWLPRSEYSAEGEYDYQYVFPTGVDESLVRAAIETLLWRERNLSGTDRHAERIRMEDAEEKQSMTRFEAAAEEAREQFDKEQA
jgi:hypothetical protein